MCDKVKCSLASQDCMHHMKFYTLGMSCQRVAAILKTVWKRVLDCVLGIVLTAGAGLALLLGLVVELDGREVQIAAVLSKPRIIPSLAGKFVAQGRSRGSSLKRNLGDRTGNFGKRQTQSGLQMILPCFHVFRLRKLVQHGETLHIL